MIYIYRILINIVLFFSPLIILVRLIKKKEDIKRFWEKLSFFTKKRRTGKLIWFHGASVGEIQSVIPLIEKIEKNKNISQILITSNTLSSSKIISKFSFKKITHQFFPIDSNFISQRFLNYWKPNLSIFIDSEIWPNTLSNLKKKNIPTILINGRITKKSFQRWSLIKNFSKRIFANFNLCLASSNESKKYLKALGAQKVRFVGNLKFSESESEKNILSYEIKNFFKKKKIWCASSTHEGEEIFCGIIHNKLKKKYNNLLTIIIPRHINRTESIREQLQKIGLKIHNHEPKKKIAKKTDIYLVNSYGKTKTFYSICKNVFIGGSMINHGGQNPLEAVRLGCKIIYGPYVSNFKEIYSFLRSNGIAKKLSSSKEMEKSLEKQFLRSKKSTKIQKKISLMGKNILNLTLKEINVSLKKNEI